MVREKKDDLKDLRRACHEVSHYIIIRKVMTKIENLRDVAVNWIMLNCNEEMASKEAIGGFISWSAKLRGESNDYLKGRVVLYLAGIEAQKVFFGYRPSEKIKETYDYCKAKEAANKLNI